MSIKKRIPAGILDSGFASLATFGIGVYAVRYFDAGRLGIYSLFFSAFMISSVVPASLVFTAARVRLLQIPARQRLRAYRQTMAIGGLPSLFAALIIGIAVPSAVSAGYTGFLVPMTVTGFFAAWLSPLQDHLRGLLHLGGASWGAAAVSAVQALVVALCVAAAVLFGVDPVWVPFGSLVAANATSLTVGFIIAQATGDDPPVALFTFRQLIRSGGWFLTINVLNRAADFLMRFAVVAVTAADVLGVAEGARIAARPLSVFIVGMSAVIIPQSMKAGQDGDQARGRRIAMLSNLGVFALSAAYLVGGGFDWAWNPMAHLAPIGYTEEWLVPLTIVGSAAGGMLFAERAELTGGGRERELTAIEVFAAASHALSGLLAGLIGPFVMPVGMLASAAIHWVGFRIALVRHYGAHALAREGVGD